MPDGLYEALGGLRRLPMHMPGHKRNTALAAYLRGLGADRDITEIAGFDNLAAPEGILKEGMALAARLYGACRSFYLVNGSTAGILAGIRALSRPGQTAIIPRHSHMSVHNAAALSGLIPHYLRPGLLAGFGIPMSVTPALLEEAIRQAPDARLLVLTCPEYQGQMHDLPALVRTAHAAGLQVLVDAAHGAHLGLSPLFPEGAVSSGADIVVHSLHKTMPSLTQTGLAHAASESVASLLGEQLAVFQTSSPSYLLMASIDGCLRLVEEQGTALFSAWRDRLRRFHEKARGLRRLRILGAAPAPGLYGWDPGKILISTAWAGISGYQLLEKLRDGCGIELEMAGPHDTLAMSGMGDGAEALDVLAEALLQVDEGLDASAPPDFPPLPDAERVFLPQDALGRPWQAVPLSRAEGRVAAEYALAYPPGAPLLMPGEKVSGAAAVLLSRSRGILTTRSRERGTLAVLR